MGSEKPWKDLRKCPVCNKEVKEDSLMEKCVLCGVTLHRSCIDNDILRDANGNALCPYCAAISALDWLDNVITLYLRPLKNSVLLSDIVERMKNLLKILVEEK